MGARCNAEQSLSNSNFENWRLRRRLGRELSLVCVEVSLARNEPSVRGGQSLTKTIGNKCVGVSHRISVTDFFTRIWGIARDKHQYQVVVSGHVPLHSYNTFRTKPICGKWYSLFSLLNGIRAADQRNPEMGFGVPHNLCALTC